MPGKPRYLFLGLVLLLLLLPLLTGCDLIGVEKAADTLAAKIEEATTRFLVAVDKAKEESAAWRNLVDETRHDVRDFPADTGLEARAFVDFLLDRAIENVDQLNRVTDLLNQKQYGPALAAFVALQKAAQGKHPPVVTSVSPKVHVLGWSEFSTENKDPAVSTVRFYGYNFSFDAVSKKRLTLGVEDKEKNIRGVSEFLTVSSAYLTQADISTGSGIPFKPGDLRLVLLYDGKVIGAVPIAWTLKHSFLAGAWKRSSKPEPSLIIPRGSENAYTIVSPNGSAPAKYDPGTHIFSQSPDVWAYVEKHKTGTLVLSWSYGETWTRLEE